MLSRQQLPLLPDCSTIIIPPFTYPICLSLTTHLIFFILLITMTPNYAMKPTHAHNSNNNKINGHFLEYQIVEEQPINTSVGSLLKSINFHETLDSSDLESLDFGFLTLPPVDRRFFHLERKTGAIRTDVVIDREAVCAGLVSCPVEFDVTVRPLRIFQIVKVKIEILDLNDNRPSFPDPYIARQISEASDLESVVQLPAAQDPDSPANGIMKYTLEFLGSSPTQPLSPVPVHSGIVGDVAWGSVKRRVSKITRRGIERDRRNLMKNWAGVNTTIDDDDNDNHLHHHHYHDYNDRKVLEKKLIMKRHKNEIGDDDGDEKDNDLYDDAVDDGYNHLRDLHVYQLDDFQNNHHHHQQDHHHHQRFQLEVERRADGRSDVKLVLKQKLDRETEDRYKFVVWVEDGGETPLTGSMSVEVAVLDANDNSPSFENATYEVKVPEDLEVGSVLLKVKARDKDIGLNGVVTYEFSRHTNQEFGNLFGIRSDSGKIFLKDKLDYETTDVHLLTVLAEDKGPNPLPGEASVVIRVEDINDNAPEISVRTLTSDGRAHVPENIPPGAFVAYVSVTDKDGSSEDEALIGGDETGDGDGLAKKRRNLIECHIQQLHQYFSPRFTRSSEFKISTLVSFDREVSSIQTLTIVCKDSGVTSHSSSSSPSSPSNRLTSSVELIVQILDENDNKPIYGNPKYEFSLQENKAPYEVLGKVLAIDSDLGVNGQVTYALKENSSNLIREKFQIRNTSDWSITSLFQVHSTTGLLESKVSFDREFHDEYSFIIVARDNGKPNRKSSEVEVIVRILDEDDELPIFVNDKYDFRLEESSQQKQGVGIDDGDDEDDGDDDDVDVDDNDEDDDVSRDRPATVGLVQALDKDSDLHNKFDYVMEVSDDFTEDYFAVNVTSGEIKVLRPIDREFIPEFNFFVAANPISNHKRTSAVSRAFVSINIDDVNDNKPVFIFPPPDTNETIAISNMTPVGHVIARLKARDDDRGENSTVSFRFQSNQGHLFEINSLSGEVRVRTDMSSINFREVILRFTAHDSGPLPLSTDSSDLRVMVSKDIPFHDPDSGHIDFSFFLFRDGITVVVTAMTLTFLLLSLCAVLAAIACFFKRRRPCLTVEEKKNMDDFLPVEKPIQVSNLHQQQLQQLTYRTRSVSPQTTKNASNGHVISYDVTNDDVTKSNVTSVYFDGASSYMDGSINQTPPDNNSSRSFNTGKKKMNWKSLDCFKEFQFDHMGRRDDDHYVDDERRRGYDNDDDDVTKKVVVFIKEDEAFRKHFYQLEDQKKIGLHHNPFKTMPNAVHSSVYAPNPDPINFYHHGNSRQSNSFLDQSPSFKGGQQVAGHPIKYRHHHHHHHHPHASVGSPNFRICSPLFDNPSVQHPLLAAMRHNESLAPFVSQSLSPTLTGHHVIWPKKKTDKIHATPFVLPPEMTPPSGNGGVMTSSSRQCDRRTRNKLSWRRDGSKGNNPDNNDDTSDESNTPEVEVGPHLTSGGFMSVPDTKV